MTVLLIVLFTLSLLSVTMFMVNTSYLETERDLAAADLRRVMGAVSYESEALSKSATDYARWDDTWLYLNGENESYVQDNFTAETMENLGIGLVALVDSSLSLVSSVCRDGLTGGAVPFPPALKTVLGGNLPSLAGINGLYFEGSPDPLSLSVAEVTKSDGTGAGAGYLVMGMNLDTAFLNRLSERTGVVAARFFGGLPGRVSELPGEASAAMSLDSSAGYEEIYGFLSLLTPAGDRAMTIRTETPRALARQERRALTGILSVYGILALAFICVVNFGYRRWFSGPLSRLESEVQSFVLEDAGSHTGIEPLSRRQDEIGKIAGAIRDMHNRVKAAHEDVRRLNENLETLVMERTSELMSANSELLIFKKILENTSEAVVITDLDGSILELNEAMSRMTGFEREEMLGRNSRMFKSGRHSHDFYRELWETLTAEGHWEGEIWDRRKDGSVYPKWQTINVVRGESGEAVNYIGVSTDITVIKEAEEKLNHLAYYDPLTGLPNRMLFSDRVEHEVAGARRTGALFAVLYVDLDRFKHVNDSLGHVAGDTLLVQVADRIKECLRESDTLCRVGGDEFAVVLQNLEREENAGMVAQKLVMRVSQRFEINGKDVYIGASVGIALYPKDGVDTDSLLRKADGALYNAKEEGKGLYRYACGDLERVNRSRLEIEGRMHRALERGEFVLLYQPQVASPDATPGFDYGLQGAEALIRWQSEPGVFVSPGEFLPVAEDTGFIAPLGDWVLLQACRDAKRWEDAGRPVQVSVNVAPRQFDTGDFERRVAGVLETTGLSPALLKLEVTESGFMRNIGRVTDIMNRIRALGVTFAIDDFGTGYSSMNYLNRLPVDCLKIDQSFVRTMNDGESGAHIVSAIVSMAKAFGLSTVAEGVETFDQLRALQEFGCDLIQGFLISRPISTEDFERYIGLS